MKMHKNMHGVSIEIIQGSQFFQWSLVRHFGSKLRPQFSRLNEHRFRHNFECQDPVCLFGIVNEDNENVVLHCPIFEEARRDLLVSLSDIPGLDTEGLDKQSLCHLILFGNPDLTLVASATKRLD